MNYLLKSRLQDKITEWMNENCEDFEIWPEIYIGNETDVQMTNAAASVFEAIVNAQEYAKHEGYMEDA